MKSSYSGPEAWHAQVLVDEIADLQVMTRSLEFAIGYAEGVQTGRWQGANLEVSEVAEVGKQVRPGKP